MSFVNGVLRRLFFSPMRRVKLARALTSGLCEAVTLREAAGADIPFWDGPVLPHAWLMLNLRGRTSRHKPKSVRPFQPPESSRGGETARLLTGTSCHAIPVLFGALIPREEWRKKKASDAEVKRKSRLWNYHTFASVRLMINSAVSSLLSCERQGDVWRVCRLWSKFWATEIEKQLLHSRFVQLTNPESKFRSRLCPSDTKKITLTHALMMLVLITALCHFFS